MFFLGVDVGSLSCDAVIIDDDQKIIAWAVIPTGARNIESIERVCANVLEQAKISKEELGATIATGYGRDRVAGRLASVTEITCHARGIQALLPGTEVLVDIGGQDSKVMRLNGSGQVLEFAMNDKCAAGTGRFLQAMARALEIDVADLGSLDEGACGDLTLSSMCTVFAESEVVSLIAEGVEVSEIVHGLHRAIASRTQALVKRVAPDVGTRKIAMSGGVARNTGVVKALAAVLENEILCPRVPDITGALGAALIARERTTS
ncbi:MAG: 2-hydroxyglutaryl-CoA dehydratase [Deltaproteobacteria bacterium]|nr:2-hydroxyglutaryl-CoA dehydratase [Deltaproteobacteria bacterium]